MRKIHLLLFLVLLLLFAIGTQAQRRERISNPYGSPADSYDKLNLGIGFGFDYGGIGRLWL